MFLTKKNANVPQYTRRDKLKDELARRAAISMHERALMLHLGVASDHEDIDRLWETFSSSYTPSPGSWVVYLNLGDHRGKIRRDLEKNGYDQLSLAVPAELITDSTPTIEYSGHELVIEGQWPEVTTVDGQEVRPRETVYWRDHQAQSGSGGFHFRRRKPISFAKTRRGETLSLYFSENEPEYDGNGRYDLRVTHLLIAGATGSGKSSLVNSVVASAVLSKGRRGNAYSIFAADAKASPTGLQAIHDKLGFVAPTATTTEEIAGMFKILEAIRAYRMNRIRPDGLAGKFCDAVGDRRILVFFDEFPSAFSNDDGLIESVKKLAAMGRESRINIIMIAQSPLAQSFGSDTTLRANLDSTIAFRVRDDAVSRVAFGAQLAKELPAHMLPKPGHLYCSMADGTRVRAMGMLIEPQDIKKLPSGSWVSETFVDTDLQEVSEITTHPREVVAALEAYYRRRIMGENFGRVSTGSVRGADTLGESRFQTLLAFGEKLFEYMEERGMSISLKENYEY